MLVAHLYECMYMYMCVACGCLCYGCPYYTVMSNLQLESMALVSQSFNYKKIVSL